MATLPGVELGQVARGAAGLGLESFLEEYPCHALLFARSQSVGADTSENELAVTDVYINDDPSETAVDDLRPPLPRDDEPSFARIVFLPPGTEPVCLTVGRAARSAIRIPLSSVSAAHAELQHDERGWSLADVGSTNGTFLDGRQLLQGEAALLADGGWIEFGPDVAARYCDPAGLFNVLEQYRTSARVARQATLKHGDERGNQES